MSSEKQPTVAELKKWYSDNKKRYENFKKSAEALKKLRDVDSKKSRTISTFNKDKLITYMQNITSYEKELRNLSRYLVYRCQVYYRLIVYNASLFCLDARSIIPNYSIVEDQDKESFLKSYDETLQILNKINLQYEMFKMYVTCFREDVSYGCVYYDDTGLFILPLDPDYCRINGVYQQGDFAFEMDMSYFSSRQELLELWGEPFNSMYKSYQSEGNNGKWQPMPDEYCICHKFRAEDWETVVPPFSGLFNSFINLSDLEDIQAIADEQQIYKMIWLEMETLSNTNEPDDWKVDPDIMLEYYRKMVEEGLPEYCSAAIVPGKLNSISFNNDQATDTTKVQNATETVLNTSGGAQILNSATISGTTAFTAAILSDTEFSISMLLPQTQAWLNRFLSYQISDPAKVKFFEVSVYTKDTLKKSLLSDAQYGLPVKLALNTLNGFNELETLSLNYLEEECLGLSSKFVPLQSTHTQSGEVGQGAPEKDVTDKTDSADESKEKRDRS